jgi:hypothetical protein
MSEKLFLGVAQEIITPKVGTNLYGYRPDVVSTAVGDDLTATAFYFEQAGEQAFMISVTVASINNDLTQEILGEIERKTGVSADKCILHSIHTHSAPNLTGTYGWGDVDREYYEQIFLPGVLKAVEKAKESVCAVTMGVGVSESYVGINRRELRADNVVYLGQNPWGAFDPKMSVISFFDERECVANMVHYGCHCTAAGTNYEISRDWAGVTCDMLSEVSGGVTAFFNGPEGDVGPRLSNGLTVGYQHVRYAWEHGAIGGRDAVNTYKSIRGKSSDVKLKVSTKTICVPLEPRISREQAQEGYAKFNGNTVNLDGAKRKYYEDVLASYSEGYVDAKTKQFKQTIIKIGDVVFLSFPYELFSEIGLRIAREGIAPHCLSLSNTNGSEGYFVSQDQICRGGYEIDMFKTGRLQPYADDADFYLIKESINHLKEVVKE